MEDLGAAGATEMGGQELPAKPYVAGTGALGVALDGNQHAPGPNVEPGAQDVPGGATTDESFSVDNMGSTQGVHPGEYPGGTTGA